MTILGTSDASTNCGFGVTIVVGHEEHNFHGRPIHANFQHRGRSELSQILVSYGAMSTVYVR